MVLEHEVFFNYEMQCVDICFVKYSGSYDIDHIGYKPIKINY